jgi:hypothetical protein
MNNFHYYKPYLYKELSISYNEIKIGGFYRIYNYKYEDTGKSKTYTEAQTPLILVLGKDPKLQLIHCLKLNNLPLRKFTKIFDNVQNETYTRELIVEIEESRKLKQKLKYSRGAKAITIDRTGRQFYTQNVRRNKDLEKYDTYRTYKRMNLKNIKELYLNVSKLKARLGFKDFNEEKD